jgi:hypothetical protein
MLLILLSNTILLFVNWLTTTYSCPIVTTYKSILAMFISPTNPKIVAIVSTVLGAIIDLIFPVLL